MHVKKHGQTTLWVTQTLKTRGEDEKKSKTDEITDFNFLFSLQNLQTMRSIQNGWSVAQKRKEKTCFEEFFELNENFQHLKY